MSKLQSHYLTEVDTETEKITFGKRPPSTL